MSKWLKSTTLKSYKVPVAGQQAIIIPSYRGEFLELSDGAYNNIAAMPVVKSLIEGGAVLVSENEPTEVSRSANKLIDSNAKLKLELTKLQEENAKLKETTHSDLADTNDALTKELEKTKKALEKAKAETEATKKEAVEELTKLKAQLDEATKE